MSEDSNDMMIGAVKLQVNEIIEGMNRQDAAISKLKEAGEDSRMELNDAKAKIRALERKNTALKHKLDVMGDIVDKKKGMTHLGEISKHVVSMSNLTQLAVTKLTVLTEINHIAKGKGGFKQQHALLQMFDDKDCDEVFKKSRTLNEWQFLINRYIKEVM